MYIERCSDASAISPFGVESFPHRPVGSIGARLEQFIEARFASKKAFAEAADMSPQQVSNYIANRRSPDADAMNRFLRAGLNVNWLLTGSGEMDAPAIEDEGMLRPPEERLQALLEQIGRSVEEAQRLREELGASAVHGKKPTGKK